MLKGQSGVTLISLVVTIIVLLILTGVSLSMVLGQNGVLTQASTAVVEQTKADVTEKAATAMTSIETEYKGAWAKDTSIKRKEYYTLGNLEDQFTGEIEVYDVTESFYGNTSEEVSKWTKPTSETELKLKLDQSTSNTACKYIGDTDAVLESNHLYLVKLTESGATSFVIVSFADKKLDNSPRINGEKQSRTAGATFVSYIDIGDEDVADYGEIDDTTLHITKEHVGNIRIDWNPADEGNTNP